MRESYPSPQTPPDAKSHCLHVAMNQSIVHNPIYSQSYNLQPDGDCIDQLGQPTSIQYASGGVSDSPRRHNDLSQPSTHSRPLGHRNSPTDLSFHTQQTIPEPGSGSISTSPPSNNSSVAFSITSTHRPSIFSSPHLSLPNPSINTNPFPHAQPVAHSTLSNFSAPAFGGIQTRITDHTPTTYLPSQRSGFSNSNPVSPQRGTDVRTAYSGNLPGVGKYFPTAPSAGGQQDLYGRNNYLYSSTDTTRLLPSTITMPPAAHCNTNSGAYQPAQATGSQDSPPFSAQEIHHEIQDGSGNIVTPRIDAKIEKGFFISPTDNCWTCYRRNYFAVQCSYTLTPHLSSQPLYLHHNGETKQIQAMAMSLSAAVDGATGKNIDLVQHTPKRDKGPQMKIQITKLCPTPPGGKLGHLPHAETPSYSTMMGYGGPPSLQAPYFPLQSQTEPSPSHDDMNGPGSHPHTPTAHQHTFERIQFKSATANNGKRRAQQQYYHLNVELYADVRVHSTSKPIWVKIASQSSSQVVVRGRSPSHYSNEGPNSTGNRNSGAGASGGGGHILGANLYGMGGMGPAAGRVPHGYNFGTSYRGNQYCLEPTSTASKSVSTASSVSGGPVESFGIDHSNSIILGSQGHQDRIHFVQSNSEIGTGLPSIFGHNSRVKDEYYQNSAIFQPTSLDGGSVRLQSAGIHRSFTNTPVC